MPLSISQTCKSPPKSPSPSPIGRAGCVPGTADVNVEFNSFDGEIVTPENLSTPGALDLEAFLGRHSKEIRFPEMAECARALKHDHGFKKLGAIGFCYGGWAVFQLGAQGA